jgi:hypothetical protein
MTNTKKNKCKDISCTHSAKFIDRYDIVDNKVVLIHSQKWHFCLQCDKVVHIDYINYHETKCVSFHKLAENCIAKGHYESGKHGLGVACNM